MRTIAPPLALPADIRLMNATAATLAAVGVAALAGMLLMWVLRQPVFAVRSIGIEGDLAHNNVLTIRANAAPRLAGNLSRSTSARPAAHSSRCRGCAGRW